MQAKIMSCGSVSKLRLMSSSSTSAQITKVSPLKKRIISPPWHLVVYIVISCLSIEKTGAQRCGPVMNGELHESLLRRDHLTVLDFEL